VVAFSTIHHQVRHSNYPYTRIMKNPTCFRFHGNSWHNWRIMKEWLESAADVG
jgi:hypothetical protein